MPDAIALRQPAAAAPHEDYDAMIARARALIPVFKERAGRTEEARRLLPETVEDLHKAGLFRILQPRRVGGSEFDYIALVDFAAVMGEADPSVGWVLGNLASHHWILGMMDARAQDEIWNADRDVLIASSFVFPAGRAQKVEGGYRIGGRWPFSSGVDPSLWNMVGAGVYDDNGKFVENRVFLIHRRDYAIIDNWDVMGLSGTGSADIEARDLLVPDYMTVPVAGMAGGPTPGSAVNPGALYQLPVFALFPFVLSGAALGNAQGCYDDYMHGARARASRYNNARLADYQAVQIRIAAAGARIDAARRIMRDLCKDAMDDARAGRTPDMETKTRYRRDGAFAVNLCTEAVDNIFAISGGGGLYRAGSVQRRFRDAHAINSHIAFTFDAAGSNFGRVALGLPSDNATL